MSNYIAIISGGTGLIGNEVIQQLISDSKFEKIIVLNRRSIAYSNSKIQEIIVDFNHLENSLKDLHPTHAFCCLGTTIKKAGSKEAFRKVDFDYVLNFAKAVHQLGCQNFSVITALGTNKSSFIFYNQVKFEITEALKNVGFNQLNILQPSLLLGERSESRSGEDTAQKFFKWTKNLWVGPLKNYAGIQGSQVAKAMIAISKSSNEGVHTYESAKLQDY
ncbi:MAG TPA: NAD-dependent epimerase/dehydratase family protein [Chitinophagales bacterium]|nr:NAD-dependent epimerase/dehydratase family protein [Chitinophagales bacterium]